MASFRQACTVGTIPAPVAHGQSSARNKGERAEQGSRKRAELAGRRSIRTAPDTKGGLLEPLSPQLPFGKLSSSSVVAISVPAEPGRGGPTTRRSHRFLSPIDSCLIGSPRRSLTDGGPP